MSFKRLPNLDNFKHQTPIQIRWDDLDPLNHVNNVVYGTYFQFSRGVYMKDVCPQWNWDVDMFVIASLQANYYRELGFSNKNPSVFTRVSQLGTRSFELEYVVVSTDEKNKTVMHAAGQTTQVMFNMDTRKSYEIPQWFKDSVLNYESAEIIENVS